MFQQIYQELDDIANSLENRGMKKLASRLDMISNTLESSDRKASKVNRKANVMDLVPDSGETLLPGAEDADESSRYDAYEAKNYHRVPVGNDSVSRILNTPSPAEMLNRLDFADKGEINIQSSQRRAKEDYSETGMDEGDPMDPFTTTGMPESGGNDDEAPDAEQEGGTLQFFGNEAPGTLHMPGSSGSSTDTEKLLTQAENLGQDGNEITMEPAHKTQRASFARRILKMAADVNVQDPKNLHHSEFGDDVVRDQSLGGLGDGPVESLHNEDSSMKKASMKRRRVNFY